MTGSWLDYPARLDGAASQLWEPLWHLRIGLSPLERDLLTCPALRRLHFIHHAGAAYLSTPHTYSRLQHTLGVFALVSHFCPADVSLRAAALLHDVGHAPFSHALEQIEGIDHHRWTGERLRTPPVVGILSRHGLDPQAILARMRGEPANLLRNNDNSLHLDHLDSWVRSAQAGGILPLPAPELLARLSAGDSHLDMDLDTAELLLDLIVAEARFHCSPANLAPNTMLVRLVRQALAAGVVSLERLGTMVDAEVEQLLFETPATAVEARRLWSRPGELVVTQGEAGAVLSQAETVTVDRLYLAMPRTSGQPVDRLSPRAAARLAEAYQLQGTYRVTWNG